MARKSVPYRYIPLYVNPADSYYNGGVCRWIYPGCTLHTYLGQKTGVCIYILAFVENNSHTGMCDTNGTKGFILSEVVRKPCGLSRD